MKTKILLVDDHAVLRKGLRLLLKDEKDINVVGDAGDGRTAIDMVRKLSPNIVVMDITMPDLSGTEATQLILSEFPDTKVIALSIHSGKRFVENMLEAGAAGYILKESAPEELVKGIRAVIDGKAYLSAAVTEVALSRYREAPSGTQVSREKPELTEQEKEVLRLLIEGNTIEQIASVLKITTRKVNAAQKKLMKTLGVNSMAQLTEYVRSGLHDKEGPAGDDIHHTDSIISSVPIMGTKLHRPSIPDDHVVRSRLVEQLNHNRKHPLILISAPAGYGKSTLASSWIETCDWPNAWLSLDADDSDLRIFMTYFVHAVQSMFPKALPKTGDSLNAAVLPPLPVLAGLLINELEMIEQEFVLVIDDFHLIRDKNVLEFFTKVLRHPNRFMHLVLIGRKDPFLPISTLRSQDQVYELRIGEIRFTTEETLSYFQQIAKEKIDDATAASWADKTEGWITGLRLAALSMQHRKDFTGIVPEFHGDAQYVMEYLFNEVLSHQPPDIRDNLLITSIVDRFSAPLFSALCQQGQGEAEPWEFIALMKKENMFIISLDAEGRWFRFHHLFQQLLKNQLKRYHSPDEIAELHSRASEWFAGQGLLDEAIQHALAAGDMDGAARLVEGNKQVLLNNDKWFVFEKWLQKFPEDFIQQRLELLMIRVWLLYHHFEIAAIPPVLDAAESLLGKAKNNQHVFGEIDFFRGYIYYFMNEGARSLKHLESARKKVPHSDAEVRGQIEILYGLATQMEGRKEDALKTLNDLLSRCREQEGVRRTRLLITLVYIHIIAADLDQAITANHLLEEVAIRRGFSYARAWSLYLHGLIHFYKNDLNQAIRYFKEAVENKYILHTRAAVESMTGLAIAYQSAGMDEKASAALHELMDYINPFNDPAYVMIAQSCRTRLSIMRGELESQLKWFQRNSPAAENMVWWLEIPSVSYCRALIAEGSKESLEIAGTRLRELLQLNKNNHNVLHMVEIMSLLAVACQKRGQSSEALDILKGALNLGAHGGLYRPFIEAGPLMVDMLKQLAKKKVNRNYIRQILAAFKGKETGTEEESTDDQKLRLPALSDDSLIEQLSKREHEVLSLLAMGKSNKEIAAKLFLATDTVKKHVYNVYQKLYVTSRVSAVAKAKELGIL